MCFAQMPGLRARPGAPVTRGSMLQSLPPLLLALSTAAVFSVARDREPLLFRLWIGLSCVDIRSYVRS